MNCPELINYFISRRNGKRYLEVSMNDIQHHFVHVHCVHKVTTYPFSSDEFFAKNHEEFDLIFIDGLHTEEQALKDISYAFSRLSEGGVMVLHDCMPPDEWHQREPEAYHEGENWNGTVWKAALRVFNESVFQCTLLDMDWGCGVIDTSYSQLPERRLLPATLEYDVHYPLLLGYNSSITAYLQQQVKVFYHLACMGNWQEVFYEQMLQLKQNGFRQINLIVLGTRQDMQAVNDICGEVKLATQLIFQAPELTYFERPALLAIEDYSRENDGYVLYLHSKGVSNPADITKVKWRRLMMRELVDQWKNCVLRLSQYDVVGVNWRDMPPTSHFCGNFWYASTKYLRKLADFTNYYENPRYQIWDRIEYKRLGCEFWIGSGKETPRILSLFCRNVDFCNHDFWRNR